jgi:hypothetical protein
VQLGLQSKDKEKMGRRGEGEAKMSINVTTVAEQ